MSSLFLNITGYTNLDSQNVSANFTLYDILKTQICRYSLCGLCHHSHYPYMLKFCWIEYRLMDSVHVALTCLSAPDTYIIQPALQAGEALTTRCWVSEREGVGGGCGGVWHQLF